jgi:hypothetical protein
LTESNKDPKAFSAARFVLYYVEQAL